jgi:hypothetical protein
MPNRPIAETPRCIYGISPDGEIAIMPPALAAQASSPDGRAAARASSPEGPRGRASRRAARALRARAMARASCGRVGRLWAWLLGKGPKTEDPRPKTDSPTSTVQNQALAGPRGVPANRRPQTRDATGSSPTASRSILGPTSAWQLQRRPRSRVRPAWLLHRA